MLAGRGDGVLLSMRSLRARPHLSHAAPGNTAGDLRAPLVGTAVVPSCVYRQLCTRSLVWAARATVTAAHNGCASWCSGSRGAREEQRHAPRTSCRAARSQRSGRGSASSPGIRSERVFMKLDADWCLSRRKGEMWLSHTWHRELLLTWCA